MAKINILSQQIYNRIAAGEVVDRPYSVVKELVENSIDAGATEVSIFVECGGKQLIRIVDNGGGIERDDLKSAYLPHATSKISNVKDLDNIHTLGFRGEAVASIASVAQMTITSKVKDSPCYSLECNGGAMGEITESAGNDGTDIQVKNLFFNTPVRLKFLKSDRAEEADITNFVSRFILDKPNISFEYYLNNKLILRSYGTTEEEAVVSVYGASVIRDCFKIDAEKHGIHIHGYIGNQNFFKPNKSYQSVFLNGRYIINTTIAAALSNAYASYTMKRQYPFYILYIDVPTEIVDVNVHPNKADVRFADNQIIYGCIYTIISSILDGSAKALDYVSKDTIETPLLKQTPIVYPERLTDKKEDVRSISMTSSDTKEKTEEPKQNFRCANFTYEDAKKEIESVRVKPSASELPFEEEEETQLSTSQQEEEKKPSHSSEATANLMILHSKQAESESFPVQAPVQSKTTTEKEEKTKSEEADFFEENKKFLMEAEAKKAVVQNKIDTSSFVYQGKLFNTFLIYECGDNAYLIDQHAAHERLIFNQLKEQMASRKIIQQPMLLPYILDLNAYESAFINDEIENIRSLGVEIDSFGTNSFKISALPVDLQGMDVKEFFNDILSDVSGLKSIKLDDLMKDKLAMAACKAAVKGGMDLTREEIDRLFVMIDGDLGLKCPHGRPVVVKLSKYEIEKMFKRIV